MSRIQPPPGEGSSPPTNTPILPVSTDGEIAARISAVVHDPFRELWRGHEADSWAPVRRAIAQGVAAHVEALAELAAAAADPQHMEPAGPAVAQYRLTVSREVLEPIRAALRDSGVAGRLEAALAETATRVDAAAEGLPALVRAPVSRSALAPGAGMGPWSAVKRTCARVLRPLVWRHETHDVAVSRVARHHLARVVLPRQARSFRNSQRGRAEWLGDLERAWSAWRSSVLGPKRRASAAADARPDEDVAACLEAGGKLEQVLRALADRTSPAPGGARAAEDLERCEGVLLATVAVAGTFVANDAGDVDPPPLDRRIASRWDRWAGETGARLDLYTGLLDARRDIDGIRGTMLASWARSVQAVDAGLRKLEARLAKGRERAERLAAEPAGLPEALKSEQSRIVAELSEVEGALQDPARLLRALADAADNALRSVEATGTRLPGVLIVHRVPAAGAAIRRPPGPGHPVQLREAALQAFDALRAQRIRRAPYTVSEAMGRVHAAVAELREVSAYGYEAAIAELSEGGADAAASPHLPALNGLSRAADKVEVARRILFDALSAAQARGRAEFDEGLEHLFQRATADRLTGRYLDARAHVVTEATEDRERWQSRLTRAGRRFSAAVRLARGRLWPVRRALGIGTGLVDRAELRERSLASVEEVAGKLPVVYRRLFAFEPLTDPRLLAGRDEELDAVMAMWARWKAEHTRSLVVIAQPGAGVTSFLNVVAGRLCKEAPQGIREVLRERVRDEAGLAGRLGGWLGLEPAPDLGALARRVLAAPPGSLAPHVVLEGIEHLLLRIPGGAGLFEQLLAFTAQTESRIFWVLSMTASAWQLAEKRSPACVGDIERIVLDPLAPDELKRAILGRHRLSGLPLQYEEPRSGRGILRHRARRLRGTDKHRQLIETDYFQRLHRAALGSTRLALFYWLRSVDFRTVEGSLLVRPLEPLRAFMSMVDVEQSFALKAMLDHGTLTVGEFCEVTRGSLPQGRHLFRALRDLHVIEPAPGHGEDPDSEGRSRTDGPAGPESRYRIRPLMTGAVTTHLRSLNILH